MSKIFNGWGKYLRTTYFFKFPPENSRKNPRRGYKGKKNTACCGRNSKIIKKIQLFTRYGRGFVICCKNINAAWDLRTSPEYILPYYGNLHSNFLLNFSRTSQILMTTNIFVFMQIHEVGPSHPNTCQMCNLTIKLPWNSRGNFGKKSIHPRSLFYNSIPSKLKTWKFWIKHKGIAL